MKKNLLAVSMALVLILGLSSCSLIESLTPSAPSQPPSTDTPVKPVAPSKNGSEDEPSSASPEQSDGTLIPVLSPTLSA